MTGLLTLSFAALSVGLVQAWWGSRRPNAAEQTAQRRLRVRRLEAESPTTTSVELEAADGAPFDFAAGQFVQVEFGGRVRCYSLSSAPGAPLRLTIKRISGGAVSEPLLASLTPGAMLVVRGPFGRFGHALPSDGAVVFLGAGSGITPLASMAHALARSGIVRVHALVANRSQADEPLVGEVAALNGVRLRRHLDDRDGRLEAGAIDRFLDEVGGAPRGAWLCGPQPLMDLFRATLLARWPDLSIHEERFVAGGGGATEASELTVLERGRPTRVAVAAGEGLVAASRRAGAPILFGCEQGACGTCKVRVLSGRLETPATSCLTDGDRAEGCALVCVGRPSEKVVVECLPR